MSKSLGNIVAPQEVVDKQGADVLRLWVVGSDYSEDLRIGPEILKQQADVYRRFRNTLRYLLGSLDGFDSRERLSVEEMPELDRWVLHRVWQLDGQLRQACADLQFHPFFAELHTFCAVDLSAFYFDIRKDSLYCNSPDATRRRAARTVLDVLFDCLTAWLAPFLCFTAEEAWLTRNPGPENSVHLRLFPEISASWRDDALAERWSAVRRLRRVVTGALEVERAGKRIGSSLQARPWSGRAFVSRSGRRARSRRARDHLRRQLQRRRPPADAFTLADVPGVAVKVELAPGEKCDRCWQVLVDVGRDPAHPSCAAAASMRSSDTGRPPNDWLGRTDGAARTPHPLAPLAPSPLGRGSGWAGNSAGATHRRRSARIPR